MPSPYTLTSGEVIELSDDLLAEVREVKMLEPGLTRGLTVEQMAATLFLARRWNAEK